jgi:hypothetical protein
LGRFVRTVRSKGRTYFYLVEAATVNGRTSEKTIRRLTEEEARRFAENVSKPTLVAANDAAASVPVKESLEPTPAEHVRETASSVAKAKPATIMSEAAREIEPQKNTSGSVAAENGLDASSEDYEVIDRGSECYILKPRRPELKRGYVLVDEDGSVYCGMCSGYRCEHVTYMFRKRPA